MLRRWLSGIAGARQALARRRARTLVALLGVAAGVATVVATLSLGEASQQDILRRLDAMGSNLVVVAPASPGRPLPGRPLTAVTSLTAADAGALVQGSSLLQAAAPVYAGQLALKYENQKVTTTVIGVTEEFPAVRAYTVAQGSFFDGDDLRTAGRVAVLGEAVAGRLFPDGNAVGRKVLVDRSTFTVVGVLTPKGTDLAGKDQDDLALIPLSTAQRRVWSVAHVTQIYLQAKDAAAVEGAVAAAQGVLRERHRLRPEQPDDFVVRPQSDLLQTRGGVTGTFSVLLWGMAGIALLIGGIGIMALMLISIRERIAEIGLRRAVGATRLDITLQFLVEALLLSLSGGVAGTLAGAAAALGTAVLAKWPPVVSGSGIVTATVASLLIGVGFGLYPARQAAHLDPSAALRGG